MKTIDKFFTILLDNGFKSVGDNVFHKIVKRDLYDICIYGNWLKSPKDVIFSVEINDVYRDIANITTYVFEFKIIKDNEMIQYHIDSYTINDIDKFKKYLQEF